MINFPAGLVVYWITTNLWTMGQQWVVKQVIPRTAEADRGGGEGGQAAATTAAQARNAAAEVGLDSRAQ